MPYNFTHALVGLTALDSANQAVKALAAQHRGAFLIGTMGPDPYFGDSRPKPLFVPCREELAAKLHELDARLLFGALLSLAAENAANQAYALGFLCHFLLDTNAHPYIEARFSGKAHTPAEIQIDLMMADRIKRPGVPQSPARFYRSKDIPALDALHASLSKQLFAMETSGAFLRSLRKWIAVNTVSYDPHNRKLRFFRRFDHSGTLTGFLVARHPDPDDRLNLSHREWRAPWAADQARTESFPDLFERAITEATPLMNAAYAAMQSGNTAEALELIGPRRMDARPV
ncbi:MAG: zinc dependent phospholipase C family protein [Clostridiaceae bacterium]